MELWIIMVHNNLMEIMIWIMEIKNKIIFQIVFSKKHKNNNQRKNLKKVQVLKIKLIINNHKNIKLKNNYSKRNQIKNGNLVKNYYLDIQQN